MPDRFGECDDDTPEPDPVLDPVPDVVWAAKQRAINNCPLCDEDGYQGSTVCHHIDYRPAAERGRRLVTQALNQARQRKADS